MLKYYIYVMTVEKHTVINFVMTALCLTVKVSYDMSISLSLPLVLFISTSGPVVLQAFLL
jgi:hypothetical protein